MWKERFIDEMHDDADRIGVWWVLPGVLLTFATVLSVFISQFAAIEKAEAETTEAIALAGKSDTVGTVRR